MSENPVMPAAKRAFISEFEGLRGLLAAWVVFGHILLISGFTYQDGWFGILFSPVLGVYAFMMLSGFVITATLDRRQSTWTSFMTRRFLRLFPIYAICMALAIILFDMSLHISQTPAMGRFGPENLERLNDVEKNFGLYPVRLASVIAYLIEMMRMQDRFKATVFPCFENGTIVGYLSIRTKPERESIERAIEIYRRLP